MDMISNLPEAILHKIMSMLPEKDATGTRVLSKSWNRTHSTFPILVLNQVRYMRYYNKYNKNREYYTTIRKQFFNFVEKTLLRFHNQGLSIQQLKLSMSLYGDDINSGSPRIEYWMELAKERDVEVLDLKVYGKMYRIPSSVALAKSLVTLRLEGHISLDQEFLSNPMEFSSLKVLSLADVHFADKLVFQNILTSCPFIEDITLFECHGIDFVCIHGLSKLKEVKISGYVMEIEIDAPSLERFQFQHRMCNKIKMDKCTNLNELSLICFNITNQWFLQHYHLFTSLLTLELKSCKMPQRINISFPQLKVIKLESCNGLRNAYIDAPKLYFCTINIYSGVGNKLPMISFSNCSSQLEISVELDICGALDYGKLKEFFLELSCINVSASLSIFNNQEAFELQENVLQDFSIHPPVLKHLHLCVPWEENISFSLVTGLLWSCHPSIISCWLSSRKLIKVLCEAIMNGKECFCSSRHIKCWWHDLKDVKITCSSGTDGNENGVDCKTFLDALPTFTEGDASFKLE